MPSSPNLPSFLNNPPIFGTKPMLPERADNSANTRFRPTPGPIGRNINEAPWSLTVTIQKNSHHWLAPTTTVLGTFYYIPSGIAVLSRRLKTESAVFCHCTFLSN
ncbi:hypothetical protein L218DRAFT_960131 [Marasmius fiardii PR-910]|nr:hypothetical protein L218DRAFT_960131 [Marasmius fiardii PR-910]